MKHNGKNLSGYSSVKSVEKRFERTGKCNYKKCGAACCKFGVVGFIDDDAQETYWEALGFKIKTMDGKRLIIHNHPCKQLNLKTLGCKIHKNKPVPCIQFPMTLDSVYILSRGKCSYKFKKGKNICMGK